MTDKASNERPNPAPTAPAEDGAAARDVAANATHEAPAKAKKYKLTSGPPAVPVPLSQEQRYKKARLRLVNILTMIGVCVLVGVGVYLMHILAMPVGILVWTAIFVFCLRGFVHKLSSMGMNRVLATTLGYIVLVIILAVIGLLMFSPIFGINNQITSLVESLPHYVDQLTNWATDLYNRYAPMFEDETVKRIITDVQSALSNWMNDFAEGSANGIVDAGTVIVNSGMAIGFGAVIGFWVLIELPGIGREVNRIINPKYAEDAQFIHLTITRVMGGYIKGTLLQCAIIGVACGILFAVVDVPYPAALGVITGVFNIIPIVGPWIGGAVAAIMAVFASPIKAIIVIIGISIIEWFVYTFISPRIMASSVDVHPAVTLFALMVGSAIGGAMDGLLGSLVGMLASIPAAAALKSLFIYYFERKTGRRIVSEDGVFFKGAPYAYEADHLPDAIADATSPHPASVESLHRQRKRKHRWEHFKAKLRGDKNGSDDDAKSDGDKR